MPLQPCVIVHSVDDELGSRELVVSRRVGVRQDEVRHANAIAGLTTVIPDGQPVKPLERDDERSPEDYDNQHIQCISPPADPRRCKLKGCRLPGGGLVESTEYSPPDHHPERSDGRHLDRESPRQFEVSENRLGVIPADGDHTGIIHEHHITNHG